ncbi:autotransporter domain-containing protein [Microvirga sp. GCM10011540]|uniref:autotransporter family protein n=1 Tax=Microvirga sp. GCM10011540 TaxID=3317338 RepID=UPI00360E2EA1
MPTRIVDWPMPLGFPVIDNDQVIVVNNRITGSHVTKGNGILIIGLRARVIVNHDGSVYSSNTGISAGIRAENGAMIENYGVISAGSLMSQWGAQMGIAGHDLSIVNAGTIAASYDQSAIEFTRGVNRLELRSPTGNIIGDVVANGHDDTLALGGSGENTIDLRVIGDTGPARHRFRGFERLEKTGSGKWTAQSTSAFSGPTTVKAGTLALNGELPNSIVTVEAGATLSGNGLAKGITVLPQGILAPGNSIGQLRITGNLTLAPGAVYRVEADAAGNHDRIVVAGNADVAGATLDLVLADGLAPVDRPLEVITAEGETTGTFKIHTNSVSDFLEPTVREEREEVVVTFERNDVPLASAETTSDDKDTAAALDALGNASELDDAVLRLDAATADRVFDLVAGEAHASAATVAYGDARLVQDTLLNRLRMPLGGAPTMTLPATFAADGPGVVQPVAVPYPTLDPRRFALWGEGFGSWGRIAHNGNASGMETATGGFILGAEALLDPAYRIGIAGGFTSTRFDVDALASSGENQGVFGALYGSARWGAINLRLGASYSAHNFDVQRTIAFPGFADRTTASYDGSTMQAFGEIGYGVSFGRATLEPFAGASVLRLRTKSFVEDGGDAALLGYGHSFGLATTTLGVRGDAKVSDDLPLTLRGLLGWRHAFGDVEPHALLAFAGGTTAFTVSGVPVDRDAVVAEAGLEWQASEAISLGVGYSGQIGARAQEHTLKGNFTWRF